MNNRYTFKAKTKQGKWVYGNLLEPKRMYSFNGIDRSNKFCLIVESSFANGGWVTVGTKHWVLKDTICQCTGLQDIDGNYIFENDIVELNNIEFRVDYSYGSFEFSHDADIDKNCDDADYINPIDYKVDECKIISNKFDKEVE